MPKNTPTNHSEEHEVYQFIEREFGPGLRRAKIKETLALTLAAALGFSTSLLSQGCIGEMEPKNIKVEKKAPEEEGCSEKLPVEPEIPQKLFVEHEHKTFVPLANKEAYGKCVYDCMRDDPGWRYRHRLRDEKPQSKIMCEAICEPEKTRKFVPSMVPPEYRKKYKK